MVRWGCLPWVAVTRVCGRSSVRAAALRVTATNTPAAVAMETFTSWGAERGAAGETSGSTTWVRVSTDLFLRVQTADGKKEHGLQTYEKCSYFYYKLKIRHFSFKNHSHGSCMLNNSGRLTNLGSFVLNKQRTWVNRVLVKKVQAHWGQLKSVFPDIYIFFLPMPSHIKVIIKTVS